MRLELTTFRLWDWRAAYCANEAAVGDKWTLFFWGKCCRCEILLNSLTQQNINVFLKLLWCSFKSTVPRVRLELTTFRLWDWRAAYCANEAAVGDKWTLFFWGKCCRCEILLNSLTQQNINVFLKQLWCSFKSTVPRVRLELTTFRLWDWRAAYCANEAAVGDKWTLFFWGKCCRCEILLHSLTQQNINVFLKQLWCSFKSTVPRVRLELTTFRLWDWRAAYCANEAAVGDKWTLFFWGKCCRCEILLNC